LAARLLTLLAVLLKQAVAPQTRLPVGLGFSLTLLCLLVDLAGWALTTRKAAQRRYVDMHMHMPASSTLGRAAAVRNSVEQALMSAVPGLRATIQLLPSDVEAHFNEARDLI
jgi:hypothetical protein